MGDPEQKVFELLERLQAEKTTILSLWREIGEFIFPTHQDFYRYFANQSSGSKRRRPIFDPTGEQSLDIFASSMVGLLANPATKWVAFQTSDVELLNNREIQLFLDEAQAKVLSVFNNPRTKFYDNLFIVLKLIGAFGSGMLMMDEDDEVIVKFRAESPRNFDYTEDFSGNINEIFFEKEFTIAALKTKAEKDNWQIPPEVLQRRDTEKIEVIRHIKPNDNFKPDGLGEKFAKFHSMYYLKEMKRMIHKGFFNMPPASIGRWDRLDGEKWPDSPGRAALGNVKLMQAADRAMTVAMEKELKPTLFVSSEAKFGKLDTSAGTVNVGRGNPNDSVRELRTNGQGVLGAFQWMETKRQQIRQSFFVDVFQTAQDINMTATEASIRNQERLRGIAPKATKIQSDILGVAAEKVLLSLIKAGKIEVPELLKAKPEADFKVVYLSPLAQAQRLEDANNINRYIGDIGNIAQAFPEVLDRIDPDSLATELADIRGVPEKILRPAKSRGNIVGFEDLREQRQQEMKQQETLQTAQQVAEVAQLTEQQLQ